jgi:hypothetical protein
MNSIKFHITLYLLLLVPFTSSSQSEFSGSFILNQQFVGEDNGINYEGQINYRIHPDISIGISAAQAHMIQKDSDKNYDLGKFGIHISYAFGNYDNFTFQSIVGFSSLHFSEDIVLKENQGIGLDLGVQLVFGIMQKFHYGFKIVTSYSNIAPGSIVNTGVFATYNI